MEWFKIVKWVELDGNPGLLARREVFLSRGKRTFDNLILYRPQMLPSSEIIRAMVSKTIRVFEDLTPDLLRLLLKPS